MCVHVISSGVKFAVKRRCVITTTPNVPRDVTDQYNRSLDNNQFSTILINESDMFENYEVTCGNDTFIVVCSKDNNSFLCKSCDSDHCDHVKEAQQYRSTL